MFKALLRAASVLIMVALAAAACVEPPAAPEATSVATLPAAEQSAPSSAAAATAATQPTATLSSPTASPAGPSPSPTRAAEAPRPGAEHVLKLPREDSVPADFLMARLPDYQVRNPSPSDTYRFACQDLPARSIGVATVSYRHLSGLPSVSVEYVIYPDPAVAGQALADMQDAMRQCPNFTIGEGTERTATLAELALPPLGDSSFAMTLSTEGPTTGSLETQALKMLVGEYVVGINYVDYATRQPGDSNLLESVAHAALQALAQP